MIPSQIDIFFHFILLPFEVVEMFRHEKNISGSTFFFWSPVWPSNCTPVSINNILKIQFWDTFTKAMLITNFYFWKCPYVSNQAHSHYNNDHFWNQTLYILNTPDRFSLFFSCICILIYKRSTTFGRVT